MAQANQCPNCKSKNTVPVVQGLPSNNTAADTVKGGTSLSNTAGNGSTMKCRDCNNAWEVKSLFDNMREFEEKSK